MERKEAIEVIKKNWPDSSFTMLREALETVIPELKESEDEKIRKEIKDFFSRIMLGQGNFLREDYDWNAWIAWLEKQSKKDILEDAVVDSNEDGLIADTIKQGEHANFINKIQIGDKVTRNEDGVLVNLSQLKRIAKKDEKQGQTFTKKDVDDAYLKGISDAKHELEKQNNMSISEATKQKLEDNLNKALEKETAESWNEFLDKQGEQKPVELSENRSKELSLSLQIQAYLNTASDELYAKGKPLYSEERIKDIHKCMLMWQKLHNTYFYQKPAWSEEVQEEQVSEEFINALGTMLNDGLPDMYLVSEERIKKSAELLFSIARKQLKNEKQEWSEEDKGNMSFVESLIIAHTSAVEQERNLINWLKSLKDRVQPKQEWSEEDRRILYNVKAYIGYAAGQRGVKDELFKEANEWLNSLPIGFICNKNYNEDMVTLLVGELEQIANNNNAPLQYQAEINWLKSLRPQSTWKPSEGQLECLGYAIEKAEKDWSHLTNNRIYLTLKALKEQLEKL